MIYANISMNFFYYWVITGSISYLWSQWNFYKRSKDSEKQKKYEMQLLKVSYESGIGEEDLEKIINIALFLFGFVLLPVEIIAQIAKIFTKTNILTGEPIEEDEE